MPPAFDPETYIDRVLRPFGRTGSRELPPLVVRYALDEWPPEASDQDLLRRVGEVVDLWRRQEEGGTAGIAEACRHCLAEDELLRHQEAYIDPRWWRGRIRDWQGQGQPSDPGPERASPSADHPQQPSATAERDRQSAPEPQESANTEVPPELLPPTHLTAETHDDCVILRWQPPPAAPTNVRFMIERLSGTTTQQFAATSHAAVKDSEPPAGRTITYRVFADHAGSGARSDATIVRVVFTPPVTDLAAGQVRDGRVVGHWQMHPDVWRADVWRTLLGSPTDRTRDTTIQARAGGFDDPQPPPGRYKYSAVPVYQDPDSDQTYRGPRAEVEVEVFDKPPTPQVSLGDSGAHEPARFTLRWSELPDGVFLLMRLSAAEPAGAPGDLLMTEEAEQVGQPLWNGQGVIGTAVTLALPAGRWVLVPFAVAGGRAARGDCLSVDVVPPVTLPEAVRNGPDVQVSWVWPDGLRLARVIWRADGVDSSREVTRSEFQGRGGVTFRRNEAASIRITGIVRTGVDELTSAAVTVTAPAQLPTLTYRVTRIPGLLGLLPWSRRRRVVLDTDLPCAGLQVVIYVHAPGGGRESDLQLAVRDDLDLGPGRPKDVMVTIPKAGKIARPCYLSCRATTGSGEVRVDDFGSRGREIR